MTPCAPSCAAATMASRDGVEAPEEPVGVRRLVEPVGREDDEVALLEPVDLVRAVGRVGRVAEDDVGLLEGVERPVPRPVDEGRKVAGGDVAGVSGRADPAGDEGREGVVGDVGGDEPVQLLDELLGVALDEVEGAQVGPGGRHEDGRGEAVPGDVADEEVEASRPAPP